MSFSVPVLPIDFYEHESFERIIESLERLEKVFDSIVTAIEGKVAEFNDRVATVGKRIEVAAGKVSHMEGSTKGFMIKSCPVFPKGGLTSTIHFPTEHAVPKSEQLFHVNDSFGNPPNGKKEDVKMVTRLLSQLGVPASKLLDTRSNHELLGLGEMRESVSSVTSLFIFNTKNNAYQTVVTEMNPEMSAHQLQGAGFATLPDAKPLTSQDPLSHVKQEFNYQPESGKALDVPMPKELPLSGIAQLDWDDDDDEEGGIFILGATKPAASRPPDSPTSRQESLPALPSLPSLQTTSVSPPAAPPKAPELKLPEAVPKAPPPAPSLLLPTVQSKPPPAPALPSLDAPSKPTGPPKDLRELPKPADPSSREALLDSLRSSNPLARLRPTKTKEPPKPGAMNPMDMLKNQVQKRFEAIHQTEVEVAPRSKPQPPKKRTEIDLSSSDDSD